MHLPAEMALAVFDSLETSYLSLISLREYFSELEIGNFPEGQSIREQSNSILRGHTIWDVFEYRLFQTFVKLAEDGNLSAALAKNTSDLVAQLADRDYDEYVVLNTALCESILFDALSEISQPSHIRSLSALRVKSGELASHVFSVWVEILTRLDILMIQPDIRERQTHVLKLIFLEEERYLRTLGHDGSLA